VSNVVILTDVEIELANLVGKMQFEEVVRKSSRGKWPDADGKKTAIEAAAGEVACAKFLNQYWIAGVNTYHRPDVGVNIQVRTTKYPNGHLPFRPSNNDPVDHVYYLVTGEIPTFVVVGWILGRDCMNPAWVKDPGANGSAFFVPQSALKKPENGGIPNGAVQGLSFLSTARKTSGGSVPQGTSKADARTLWT
jgi:hypothetical protein